MIQEGVIIDPEVTVSTASILTNACQEAGISQRQLASRTGISQSTLSRLMSGERSAKLTELVLLADALGCPLSTLTGNGAESRVVCTARSTDGADMTTMRRRLVQFVDLDADLADQGFLA